MADAMLYDSEGSGNGHQMTILSACMSLTREMSTLLETQKGVRGAIALRMDT
jgi:hypothetical protein